MAGAVPLPIPLVEIVAWCDLAAIHDTDDREELMELIRAADDEWLSRQKREE